LINFLIAKKVTRFARVSFSLVFRSLHFPLLLGITDARKYIAFVKRAECDMRLCIERDINKALKSESIIVKNQAHNNILTNRLIRKGLSIASIGKRKMKDDPDKEDQSDMRAREIELIKKNLDKFHVEAPSQPPSSPFHFNLNKEKKSHLQAPTTVFGAVAGASFNLNIIPPSASSASAPSAGAVSPHSSGGVSPL
jgi:hypothetical protein